MFLNLDQLEKQLDKEEFQEIGSMAAGRVLATQFQNLIQSRISLDDEDGIMTRKYFLEYTQLEVQQFRDTLIQHMESIKKSIDKRALHKREYDSKVNEIQMQKTKETVDTSKALDASLVDIESSRTKSGEQDTSSRSGNDAHDDDADIRPIYDEEPMDEVQTTAEINVFATGQHHTEQPEFNNEGEVDQDAEQYVIETINIELEHKVAKLLKENVNLTKHYKELSDSIKTTRAKTIEHTTSLIAQNAEFKTQLQEKGFAIAALKNELRKLTGNSVNTKFAKPSILGKSVLQPHKNQSVVRQLSAFKSERPRISKPRFATQVDVNNDLSKPITTHYLPKVQESAVVKPNHVIASSESRNSSKSVSTSTLKETYDSNDMIHNYYLEDGKKKTQEKGRNSEPSVMPSARSQSIDTTKTVPIAEHSRKSRNFSDFKHFVCSTCQKCVFNTNHDACVTKFLNEVNSRAMEEQNLDLSAGTPSNLKKERIKSNYVLEILKKYGMENCDPVGTPMETKNKLDLDKNGTPVDATKYRSMIGTLMYLTSSRPDIVHATCLCARYQAQPTEKHLKE
ncbi:hypothetical protein Tco_0650345, partial [Tanacetum coccineum]